jgi:uncharacterized protein
MDLLDWAGLAATTAGAALLYTLTGFGFAVLAAPLFLLFVDPPRAIQLVIILSTALSLVALPGLWRAIAPRLLLRLGLGSLAGLPLGLIAFRHADPILVRALVGATILGFAVLLWWRRHHGPGEPHSPFGVRTGGMRRGLEVTTGVVSGAATAGIPARTWFSAAILIPFAALGGLAGRPLGDRLDADAFAMLVILLLGAAGLYTLAGAVGLGVR